MSADMEIKITIRGNEAVVGGTQRSDQSDVPSPSPDITGALEAATGDEGAPPSPIDAMGASGLDSSTAPAPSPTMDGAETSTATASALPEPVPLDEIANLGSSEGPNSAGSNVAPEPQGGLE